MPNYIYAVGRRRRKNNSYTYTLSSSTNSPIEGQTINFTVNTTAPNGKIVFYSIEHILTSGADFTGSTSGSVTIASGSATFSIVVNNDVLIENGETFKVALFTGSANGRRVAESSTITIAASDIGYSIVPSTLSVDEPGTVNFVVTARGLANGTLLYYDVEHIDTDSADFTGATSGTITIMSETASFGISTVADVLTEGPQKFRARVRTDSASGTVVVQSADITIVDTSASPQTYTIAPNPVITSTDEGTTVTFSIVTTNVFNGTTLYYDIEHISTLPADFTGATSGTVSIQSNAASFSVSVKADLTTDSAETFRARLRTVSASGTVVASSDIITVNDTSYGYLLTSSATSINEGESVIFTISTSGLSDGTLLPYTITGVFQGDILEPLNGNFVINSNIGSKQITTVIDGATESTETMTMTVGGISRSVSINNVVSPGTTATLLFTDTVATNPDPFDTWIAVDRYSTKAGFIYAYLYDNKIEVWKTKNNSISRDKLSDPLNFIPSADKTSLLSQPSKVKFSICNDTIAITGANTKFFILKHNKTNNTWSQVGSPIIKPSASVAEIFNHNSLSLAINGDIIRLLASNYDTIELYEKNGANNWVQTFTTTVITPDTNCVYLSPNGQYFTTHTTKSTSIPYNLSETKTYKFNVNSWIQYGGAIEHYQNGPDARRGATITNAGDRMIVTVGSNDPNPFDIHYLSGGQWVKAINSEVGITSNYDTTHINANGNVFVEERQVFRNVSSNVSSWYASTSRTVFENTGPNLYTRELNAAGDIFVYRVNNMYKVYHLNHLQ